MSARDELTTLILGKTASRAAEAIIAAGYTKPRTVTTVEELDALPVGSIILDNINDTCRKSSEDLWDSLIEYEGGPYRTCSLVDCLPATVLHVAEG